jgi:capsular polysaccharide biosynthesis protein
MAQNLGLGLPSHAHDAYRRLCGNPQVAVMADEVIAKFGLMDRYTTSGRCTIPASNWQSHLRISVTKEKVIKVTVEDADPQRAADIASLFVSKSRSPEPHLECQQGQL